MGLLIMAAIPTLGQTDIDELEIVNETNDDGGFIHDGLIRVQDDNFKFGFIDKTGKVVIPCKWEEAKDFSEGLAPVQYDNGKWGFIDKYGLLTIPCKWVSVADLSLLEDVGR